MSLFCLVHGVCEGAWCWDLVIPKLEAPCHKTVAMDLPIENPETSLLDYVDATIEALPKNEEDVILVAHSMAGTFTPLVAYQRPVRKLVFVSALIPYPGTSVLDQSSKEIDADTLKAAGYKPTEASKLELFYDEPDIFNPAWLGKNPLENEAVAMEFLDCEPDVARWAIAKLRGHQSMAHIVDVYPEKALPNIEYAYIACTEDKIISPVWMRYAARKRLGVEAIEIPGGHCPSLSCPEHLANALLSLC